MQAMKFVLVVNPQSGKKQSAKILDLVKPIFDSKGAEVSIIRTDFPGHARDLAMSSDLDGYDGFLVLGGDGTFNEVVNGMFARSDGKTFPIGLIPGGSGNSLLHDLGLVDSAAAADAIVAGHTRLIDAAQIHMNGKEQYSTNLIGWGLVTDVGKRAEQLRWIGPIRYTAASIIEVFLKKHRQARLVIDDKTFVNKFTFVVACNSIHVGNGMKMAPYAELDDGLIDIIFVDANITKVRLLSVLPKLFDGTHVHEPEVEYYRASSFSLIPETDDILNIDGEMTGTTPIMVKMLKQCIEIFA
jgi:YegS/Rv2252/BmrU family lipid kinase